MTKKTIGWFELLLLASKRERRNVILTFLFLLVVLACDLAGPLIIKQYIDTAIAGSTATTLIEYVALYTGIALTGIVASVITSYLSTQTGWGIADMIRSLLLTRILKKEKVLTIERTPTGELLEKVEGNVDIIGSHIAESGFKIIGNTMLALGVIVIMISIIPTIGLALSIFLLALAYLLSKLSSWAITLWKTAREAKAQTFGFINESIEAANDIRVLSTEQIPVRKLDNFLQCQLQYERKAYVGGRAFWPIIQAVFAVIFALCFGLGIQQVSEGAISIGILSMIYLYVDRLREPLEDFASEIDQIQQLIAVLKITAQIIPRDSLQAAELNTKVAHSDAIAVEFKNVNFRYDGASDDTLKDLCLQVEAGSRVGIIGKTGAGKSTILNLICGLEKPTKGQVSFTDEQGNAIEISNSSHHISVLSQKNFLFDATVKENLTLFNSEIKEDEIWRVLQLLDLDKKVKNLVNGLDTKLIKSDNQLSDGEVQLLLGARLFLSNSGLIVVDEATSLMDQQSEEKWLKLLAAYSGQRTQVMVSHRLRTLHNFDKVYQIKHGQIEEVLRGEDIASLQQEAEIQ
ncbi:ABC transporter ATP-binding protein [Vibrio cholerae]|nr:ABC transporter ATP-binding protein [Vibrio cholerae]